MFVFSVWCKFGCLGDDIWRTGCCPCSTSPLSTSLIDPKEQRNCYSLAPVPSQELPERGCRQQRTAYRGSSNSGFFLKVYSWSLFHHWIWPQGSRGLQGLHTRANWTRSYTTAAESSRAASNQRTWTVYIYWPVSPLLTSGGLLTAAWNAHDKRQTPYANSFITDQLLADWSHVRASCPHSRSSIRLRAASDSGSGNTVWQTCQPPSKWDWRWPSLCRLDLKRTGSVGELLTDCAQGWAVRKQWWGDGAISTTPSRWIATVESHRRWPTSSTAAYYTRPVRQTISCFSRLSFI